MLNFNYDLTKKEHGHNQLRMLIEGEWPSGSYNSYEETFVREVYPNDELRTFRAQDSTQLYEVCIDGLYELRRAATAIGLRDRKEQPDLVLPADAPGQVVRRYGSSLFDVLLETTHDQAAGNDIRSAADRTRLALERIAEAGLLWGRHPTIRTALDPLAYPEQVMIRSDYNNGRITTTYRESAALVVQQKQQAADLSRVPVRLRPRGYDAVLQWRAESDRQDISIDAAPDVNPATAISYDELLTDVQQLFTAPSRSRWFDPE